MSSNCHHSALHVGIQCRKFMQLKLFVLFIVGKILKAEIREIYCVTLRSISSKFLHSKYQLDMSGIIANPNISFRSKT